MSTEVIKIEEESIYLTPFSSFNVFCFFYTEIVLGGYEKIGFKQEQVFENNNTIIYV